MSIRSIGEKLKDGISLSEEEKIEFDDFREKHNIIIDLFNKELKEFIDNRVNELNKKSIEYQIVFRNKRVETIIEKLRRPNRSKLERIQDIAGSRIILENIEELRFFINIFNKISGTHNFTKKNKKFDYVTNPKKDGYRSVHYVFSYNKKENYFKKDEEKAYYLYNKKIELQVRTKIQHIWATALETYDIIYKSSMKTGTHNKLKTWEGLFFKRCSLLFEGIELEDKNKVKKNISKIFKLKQYKKIFGNIKKIKNIKKITLPEHIKPEEKLILITYIKEKRATFFTTEDTEGINTVYRTLEANNKGDYIVLLLTVKDIRKLKEIYPNYFFDIGTFIEILELTYKAYREEEIYGNNN